MLLFPYCVTVILIPSVLGRFRLCPCKQEFEVIEARLQEWKTTQEEYFAELSASMMALSLAVQRLQNEHIPFQNIPEEYITNGFQLFDADTKKDPAVCPIYRSQATNQTSCSNTTMNMTSMTPSVEPNQYQQEFTKTSRDP